LNIPTEIVVAVLTVVGGAFATILTVILKAVLSINNAVNHRHKKTNVHGAPVDVGIFDLVIDTHDRTKSNGHAIRKVENKVDDLYSRVTGVTSAVDSVNTWRSKYTIATDELKEIVTDHIDNKEIHVPKVKKVKR
jgi:hypothetical protein